MEEIDTNLIMSSKQYISCIVIKGRPILPPIMTPLVYNEMHHYKLLALETERKLQDRRAAIKKRHARLSAASAVIESKEDQEGSPTETAGKIDTGQVSFSNVIGSPSTRSADLQTAEGTQQVSGDRTSPGETFPERNTPGADLSTPPSVASTDLARYMNVVTDREDQSTVADLGNSMDSDSDSCRLETSESHSVAASGRSSLATVVPDEQQNLLEHSPIEDGPDAEEFVKKHFRRSSYTLEQPSSILVAHFQKLQQDAESASRPTDDMTTNRNESQLDRNNSAAMDDQTSREQHLQRYLNQMASFTVDGGQQELPSSRHDQMNGESIDADSPTSDLAVRSHSPTFEFEQLLLKQHQRFNQLREELEESHRQQLSRLRLFDASLSAVRSPPPNDTSEILAVERQTTELSIRTSLPGSETEVFSTRFPVAHQSLPNSSRPGPDLPAETAFKSPNRSRAIKVPPVQFPFRFKAVERCKRGRRDVMPPAQALDAEMKPKFDRLSAAVKGYLTRRLMRTEKVQAVIKTIQDTLEFACQLHSETPLKEGRVTPQDATLHQRLIAQLSSACYEFHDIFFKLTSKEKMMIISQDRTLQQEKLTKNGLADKWIPKAKQKPRLSSATLKAMERKRYRMNASRQSSKPPSPYFARGRSPRDDTSREVYQQLSTDAIRPRTTSPRMQFRDVSQKVDQSEPPARHRVRRSLYGQQPIVKAKSKACAVGRLRPSGARSAR